MKKVFVRTFTILMAFFMLLSVASMSDFVAGAEGHSTDVEGNNFNEAYSLAKFTSDTYMTEYYGDFSIDDNSDYFKIQAPNFDANVQFYLFLRNDAFVRDGTLLNGSTVVVSRIYIYDSDFQCIGYAYEGLSYDYVVNLPGYTQYLHHTDTNKGIVNVQLEKNKTYYIRIERGPAYINPTLCYGLSAECQPNLIIESLPQKTAYYVGDRLDKTGLKVAVHYPNGSVKNVTNYKVDVDSFDTVGRYKVTVSCVEEIALYESITICASFYVDVLDFSGDSGVFENLYWSISETGVLTIWGEGGIPDRDDDNNPFPWERLYNKISTIVIENGIESVGDFAFFWYFNKAKIVLPNTLKSIGESAFGGADGLGELVISSNVELIEENAFGSTDIKKATILSPYITTIKEWTFYDCYNLTEISLFSDVKEIQKGAFGECPNLSTINFYGSEEEWKNIYVSDYNDDINNATVNYYPVSSISINTLPDKTVYKIGEELDTIGLSLLVNYSNGYQRTVPINYSCSPSAFMSTGTVVVTVSYGGKTATFTVTVNPAPVNLSSISVKTMPTKTTYNIGDSFNQSGLTLTAKYSDNSTQTITSGFTCSGFSSATAGTKTVTVTYEGKTTTFTVTVNPAPVTLSSISVKTMPTKTTYNIGESFNQSGLTLTAKYSDSSTKTITSGFACTGFSSTTAGTKTITVNYEGKTTTFNVTVVKVDDPKPTVSIHNFTANKTVDYKTTITFSADVKNAVSGATVHWFIDGKDAGTGNTYTVTKAKKSFTVQAKYMKDGKVLAESGIESVNVKTGFFAKLAAFFRSLFGALPKVVQGYLGVDMIEKFIAQA